MWTKNDENNMRPYGKYLHGGKTYTRNGVFFTLFVAYMHLAIVYLLNEAFVQAKQRQWH